MIRFQAGHVSLEEIQEVVRRIRGGERSMGDG